MLRKNHIIKASLFVSLLFFQVFGIISCSDKKTNTRNANDPVLAEVYGNYLHKSDINYPESKNITKEDSLILMHTYINHWIRKKLLAYNASKNIGESAKIDKLVEDYKNSLQIDLFEKQYIKKNLDTTISEVELQSFYDKNNSNFVLDHSIIKLLYVKIDAKKPGLDKFYENWKKGKLKNVIQYGKKYGKQYFLDTEKWYDLEKIKSELPKFIQKNKKEYTLQKNSKGYEYFLKVFATKHKNETIPLVMVKDMIKDMIIKKRKSDMIDKYIEELFEKEVLNKNIKLYK